jgi:hypothetical protein
MPPMILRIQLAISRFRMIESRIAIGQNRPARRRSSDRWSRLATGPAGGTIRDSGRLYALSIIIDDATSEADYMPADFGFAIRKKSGAFFSFPVRAWDYCSAMFAPKSSAAAGHPSGLARSSRTALAGSAGGWE